MENVDGDISIEEFHFEALFELYIRSYKFPRQTILCFTY